MELTGVLLFGSQSKYLSQILSRAKLIPEICKRLSFQHGTALVLCLIAKMNKG